MQRKELYKDYLGDGVYAHFDGYQIVLTVEDGIKIHHEICLEPAVIKAFKNYLEYLKTAIEEEVKNDNNR